MTASEAAARVWRYLGGGARAHEESAATQARSREAMEAAIPARITVAWAADVPARMTLAPDERRQEVGRDAGRPAPDQRIAEAPTRHAPQQARGQEQGQGLEP